MYYIASSLHRYDQSGFGGDFPCSLLMGNSKCSKNMKFGIFLINIFPNGFVLCWFLNRKTRLSKGTSISHQRECDPIIRRLFLLGKLRRPTTAANNTQQQHLVATAALLDDFAQNNDRLGFSALYPKAQEQFSVLMPKLLQVQALYPNQSAQQSLQKISQRVTKHARTITKSNNDKP